MKFSSTAEVRAECKQLDTTATMRVAEYQDLFAELALPQHDQVKCQLIREDGVECPRQFGKGWVAIRKDGVQLYIGGDCADKNFRAGGEEGQRYRARARALERENRIAQLRERIEARKDDPEFLSRLIASYNRCEKLKARIESERDALPEGVVRRLFNMRRGTSRNVPGDVRYVEKDEDKNDPSKTVDVVRWRPVSLGIIQGIEGLEAGDVSRLQQIVRDARNALRRDVVDENRLEKTLSNQIATLDASDSVDARLDEIERALDVFLTPANFRALCWLAIRDDDREAVVSRGFVVSGVNAKPQQVKATIGQWRREIEQANGGRIFRAVQTTY